jgi:hypothetical protein
MKVEVGYCRGRINALAYYPENDAEYALLEELYAIKKPKFKVTVTLQDEKPKKKAAKK